MGETDGLQPGPRDHLITRALERLLSSLDAELLEEAALDPAEGPERLARHAMREIARQLAGERTADAQAAKLNSVLRDLVVQEDDWADAEVVLPPRLLAGIRGTSPLGDVLPLPTLPATPFSQSDLLVDAEGQPHSG